MKIRILSILTAVVMLIAMFPCFSFAAQKNCPECFIKNLQQDESSADKSVKTIKVKIESEDELIEEAEEELKDELAEAVDDLKGYKKEIKQYYAKEVGNEINKTLDELLRMVKESSLKELGYTIVGVSDEDGFSFVEYAIDAESDFYRTMIGVLGLFGYWGNEYIADASSMDNVKKTVKKTIRSYYKVKDGIFNEYYEIMLRGQKNRALKEVTSADTILDCALARISAREYSEDFLSIYKDEEIKETVTPMYATLLDYYIEYFYFYEDIDDEYYDDDEDYYDDESMMSYDNIIFANGLGTLTQEEIDERFPSDCESVYYVSDWGNIPENIKTDEHYFTYYDVYNTKELMSKNVTEIEAIFNLYISRELKGHNNVDINAIKKISDDGIKKLEKAVSLDEQEQIFSLTLSKMIKASGVDIGYLNSTELGRINKALSNAYREYFVPGKYTENGYKELYRLYAYALLAYSDTSVKMFFPENMIDNVLAEMAKIPQYLPENKTAYADKLKSYIGNKKYDQKKVKPIINEGVAKIKKAENVKAVKSIYNTYKKKADKTIKTFKITTSKKGKGTITASKTVKYGASATITMKAAKGYKLSKVLVDGKKVKKTTKYTFKNVKKAHKIKAVFVKK